MTDEDEEPAIPVLGRDSEELFARWGALMEHLDATERDATLDEGAAYIADMGFEEACEEIMQAAADGELELDLVVELIGMLDAKPKGWQ